MKKLTKIFVIALCIFCFAAPSVMAIVPYSTYTYDIDGNMAHSPHAYVPDRVVDSNDLNLMTALNDPNDIFVDGHMNVYIADTKNNRVIVTDPNFKVLFSVGQFINDQGVIDSLDTPSGVFANEIELYVADTNNNRIVVFGRNDGEFRRIILEPESDVFPEGHIYKPVAVAVDRAGRIYVVSSTTHYGVISMNADGGFLGFLGAQKTSPSAFDIFWRAFQTKEQRRQSVKYVPTEYNNLTIDSIGFIYVTTSSIDPEKQQAAMDAKDKTEDYAPVKKLNPMGDDVLNRNGFYPPSGEVNVATGIDNEIEITGASSIIDVALGPNNMWSIVDSKRQKIFTYDEAGNLLFVFGDSGSQIGNTQEITSFTYQGTNMLLLDKNSDSIVIMKRTEYGDNIAAALQNQIDRKYDEAVNFWYELKQRNANFDMSYIGIGDSLHRSGNYEEAMEQYRFAYDVEKYSESFKNIRKQWIEKYIILIPIVIIVVCFVWSKFMKYAKKVNLEGQKMKEKRSFKETFLYVFHIIFHPFDGFWDMKHEKRGSISGAMAVVALTVIAVIYNSVGKAYIFNENVDTNFIMEILGVILPYLLWCISNWCLTTLFEGEGSLKDIFMATGYALLPIPLTMIPATIMSNFLLLGEAAVMSLITSIGFIWAIFLIFFGTMVIHDYNLGKNIVTTLGTIVGMALIMFIGVLFSGLVTKIVSFVYNIYIELSYRM